MERHPALAPLSRDHYRALNLAQGLKRDGRPHLRATLPSDSLGRVAHAKTAFAEDLLPHFRVEEEVLWPATRGREDDLDALWDRILDEHRRMLALVGSLDTPPEDPEALLDQLGRLLEAHVRLEERELFVACERVLDDTEMRALEIPDRTPVCRTP